MISSSNPRLERGLDAMLLVYSLLESHPASAICEHFLRTHAGWFTTTLTLLEVKAVLTKVYGVDGPLVTQKLLQVTMGPLTTLLVDGAMVVAAMSIADEFGIDLTDAVLLQAVQRQGQHGWPPTTANSPRCAASSASYPKIRLIRPYASR